MYTKAVVWATSATPLPMWDAEGSGMGAKVQRLFKKTRLWIPMRRFPYPKTSVLLSDSEKVHRNLMLAITSTYLLELDFHGKGNIEQGHRRCYMGSVAIMTSSYAVPLGEGDCHRR